MIYYTSVMASSAMSRTLVFIFLTTWTLVNPSMVALERTKRATVPCFTCTVLNRAQCCKRYDKCCSNSTITLPIPPPRTRVSPAADSVRRPMCPLGIDLDRINPTCGVVCSFDAQCAQNVRCCPPIPQCCRQLDTNQQCPATSINADECQSCLRHGSCPRGQGCCPQPGHTGCCVNARGVPTPLRSVPTTDDETVQVDASLPATVLSTSNSSSVESQSSAKIPLGVAPTSATPSASSVISTKPSPTPSTPDSNTWGEGDVQKVLEVDENNVTITLIYTLYTNSDGVVISVTSNEQGQSETITQSAAADDEGGGEDDNAEDKADDDQQPDEDDGNGEDGKETPEEDKEPTDEDDGKGEEGEETPEEDKEPTDEDDGKGEESKKESDDEEPEDEGVAKQIVTKTIEEIEMTLTQDLGVTDDDLIQGRHVGNGKTEVVGGLQPSFAATTSRMSITRRMRTV